MIVLHVGIVAQLVEQRTENPCVDGSIPPDTTKNPLNPLIFKGFFCLYQFKIQQDISFPDYDLTDKLTVFLKKTGLFGILFNYISLKIIRVNFQGVILIQKICNKKSHIE